MNRTIKFRAWDTKNKKWLEFVPCKEYMLDSDEWDCPDYGDLEEMTLFYPAHPRTNRTFNDRIIYSQFIGLQDKSGRDIFEGDIIEAFWIIPLDELYKGKTETVKEKSRFVVEYNSNEGLFQMTIKDKESITYRSFIRQRFTDRRRLGFEVVGNVFENPELLNNNDNLY